MADMASAEPVDFGPPDAASVVALAAEAGWNQTKADWQMMLSLGRTVGFRGADGTPIASAVALSLGNRIGWISMVLVTREYRRRGLATRLVETCARWLEDRHLCPVLDATPDGEEVYARMGFMRRLGLTRWQRHVGGDGDSAGRGIRHAAAGDLSWVFQLDRSTFGAERSDILSDLTARPGAISLVADDRSGFLLSRRGRVATQIGPLSSERPETALALLDAASARIKGSLFVDAFDDQSALGAHLQQLGFEVQRPFARMIRGDAAPFGSPACAFVAAGPELG